MIEQERFADTVRDHATDDSPHAHRAPGRRRADAMKHFRPASVVPPILISEAGFCPGVVCE